MNLFLKVSAKRRHEGFTLIELLLVIGIIAILAGIVILSINPRRQLAQARDAQRRSDISSILNAVYQYNIDTGAFPDTLRAAATTPPTVLNICKGDRYHKNAADAPASAKDGDCGVASAAKLGITISGATLSLRSLTGTYLVNIPFDPTWSSAGTGFTMYKIARLANGRIQVTASGEIAGIISISK